MKRQLAIEELQNYEANFLKQLIVIRDIFARPLLSSHTTIQESRRFSFHDTLFGNYHVLANHHKRILRDLEATRGEFNLYPNSTIIGDILYKHFSKMTDPYIRYVSNHVFAEYQYKLECNRNPAFVQFVEQQEAIERDFRLTLKGLLLSPIVRMAKYDLLLSTISNNTTLDQERQSLIATKSLLCDILHKINEATRNAEAEQRLMEIKFGLRIRRLSIKSQHRLSQILPDDATLIHEGTLELINRIPPTTCQVFLFSNALLITREKSAVENGVGIEFTLLDDKSIPLHMLRVGNPFSTAFSTNSSFSSNSSAQQVNILSSIRYQLSSGSYHYYQARRWNSENSGSRMIKEAQQVQQAASNNKKEGDIISMHSDDGSSTYSEVIYTISGLKLRHRIRSIRQRIKRKNKTSISYSTTSSSSTSSSKTSSISPTSSLAIKQQQTYASRGIMRPRLLQIYHIADPTLTYLFECPSTDNRLIWKKKIKSVLPNPDHGPFGLQELVSTSNYSSLRSVNGRYATGCGTIWCSLPFSKLVQLLSISFSFKALTCLSIQLIATSDGRDAIALGTQYGLWVAYSDGSELFKQILPNNCHQLELFDNRILIARIFKPNRILGAILIDHIYPPSSSANNSAAPSILTAPTIATVLAANTGAITNNSTEINIKEFQPLQKSGVISFAVGTLRGEPILVYLRRRRTGSVRLVLMFYRGSADSTTANVQQQQQEQQPWFRKFKEYRPISIQPTDIKIIQDTVYIRSRTEGIEKVDILNWIMGASSSSSSVASSASNFKYSYRISLPHHISLMSNNPPQVVDDPSLTTIAYVPLNQPGTGLICSAEAAWPVAEANADLLQQEITFETEAKSVVISYPYLIIISSNVIEVRHLETVRSFSCAILYYLFTHSYSNFL